MELTPSEFYIYNLSRFFELNPQLGSFCTSSQCLWINRNELMQINIKLDELEIKHFYPDHYYRFPGIPCYMKDICDILNQLYDRGFYKKLHFFILELDETINQQFSSLKGLEKLTISNLTQTNFIELINLKELAILDAANAINLEEFTRIYQKTCKT